MQDSAIHRAVCLLNILQMSQYTCEFNRADGLITVNIDKGVVIASHDKMIILEWLSHRLGEIRKDKQRLNVDITERLHRAMHIKASNMNMSATALVEKLFLNFLLMSEEEQDKYLELI